MLVSVEVYMLIEDMGDGSCCSRYFLDKVEAKEYMNESVYIRSDEPEMIETYLGSNIHCEASNGRDSLLIDDDDDYDDSDDGDEYNPDDFM